MGGVVITRVLVCLCVGVQVRAGAVIREAGSRGPSHRVGAVTTGRRRQTAVPGVYFKLFSTGLKLCRWWEQSTVSTARGAGRPRGTSSPATCRRWGARCLRAQSDTGLCPWATGPAVEPALAGGEAPHPQGGPCATSHLSHPPLPVSGSLSPAARAQAPEGVGLADDSRIHTRDSAEALGLSPNCSVLAPFPGTLRSVTVTH